MDANADKVLKCDGNSRHDLFHGATQNISRPYKEGSSKSNSIVKNIRGIQIYYEV
jgi:hypothetical protein